MPEFVFAENPARCPCHEGPGKRGFSGARESCHQNDHLRIRTETLVAPTKAVRMPLVRISLREGKSEEYRRTLADGVHQALVEAIDAPAQDRFQIITNTPPLTSSTTLPISALIGLTTS